MKYEGSLFPPLSHRTDSHSTLDGAQEIADGGGIAAVLGVLQRHMGNPAVAKAAAGLLRQLANNDDNKNAIVSGGGLELICTVVAEHPADAGALEQVCERAGADLKHGGWGVLGLVLTVSINPFTVKL